MVFKHDVSPLRLRPSFLYFLEMLADDQCPELSPSPELQSVKGVISLKILPFSPEAITQYLTQLGGRSPALFQSSQ